MPTRQRKNAGLIVACLVALMLVVGLPVLQTSAAAATIAGRLTAATTGLAIAGERVELSGALPPKAARTVKLQRRVDEGTWTTLGSTTSDGKGRFTFVGGVPKDATGTVEFRVTAPKARVSGTPQPAVQTPTVAFTIVQQAASIHGPHRVIRNDGFDVEALFYPARPGRRVLLQSRSGTTWTTVARSAQDAQGRAAFSQTAPNKGEVVLRAVTVARSGARKVATAAHAVIVVPSGDVAPRRNRLDSRPSSTTASPH